MTIRVATFNVENLFQRPRAMNNATWAVGQPAIDAANALNGLFAVDTPDTDARGLAMSIHF